MELQKSLLVKFRGERKWTLQALDQLTEHDIHWAASKDCNSIVNLVAHIRGGVHSRIETILYGIPDSRDRDKEFEHGLPMTKEEAIRLTGEAFDIMIQYVEQLGSNPELWMSQPYLDLPPLTYSQVNNETTALNMVLAMFREMHYHTGQIIHIAKERAGQMVWQYD